MRSAAYEIFVDGVPLSNALAASVDKIEITHEEEEAQICVLSFKIRASDVALIDSWFFGDGLPWVILLGLDVALPFGPFEIDDQDSRYGNGALNYTLTLKDSSIRMGRAQKYRKFSSGMSLGAVVTEIASEYDLITEIDAASFQLFDENRPLIQSGETDAKLLSRLAREYGFTLSFTHGVLSFKQNRLKEVFDRIRVLEYFTGKRSLVSFEVSQNTETTRRGSPVIIGGLDIEKGEQFGLKAPTTGETTNDPAHPAGEATKDTLKGHSKEDKDAGPVKGSEVAKGVRDTRVFDANTGYYVLKKTPPKTPNLPPVTEKAKDKTTVTPQTKEHAPKVAAARRAGKRSDVITASARLTLPDTTIQVGDPVEIVGHIALRHRGRWRITQFSHSLSASGFSTSLSLGKKGLGDSPSTGVSPGKNSVSDKEKTEPKADTGARPVEDKAAPSDYYFDASTGYWVLRTNKDSKK